MPRNSKHNSFQQTQSTIKRPAAGSDDSDDDDLPTDFFGLSSAPEPKVPRIGDIPALVNGVVDVMGPSLPEKQDDPVDAYGYPEVEPSSSNMASSEGVITDEEAHRLIMKYEIAPMGLDQRTYNSAAADIVDIRVDDVSAGTRCKSYITEESTHNCPCQRCYGAVTQGKNFGRCHFKKKTPDHLLGQFGEKPSTFFLAQRGEDADIINCLQAVAREEALQQQWAESKQMRRIGRQKYGF
ncbi:hypothetical protein Y032_0132g1735 [Ancylostoma ceylanicum]|uniref:Uncharacterized protein n=1 Tax=Ancylostoma ceylanicum TaxID=53326 RepID=A0A016T6T1_9BILA|nr:hypothetical protein Y032_0132g1735 [Ancylostoma ceylanicum]